MGKLIGVNESTVRHVTSVEQRIWEFAARRSPGSDKVTFVPRGKDIIIIGIQPLGRSGQRPELSQSTGMALVRCILGKFLGVVCHCFPQTQYMLMKKKI